MMKLFTAHTRDFKTASAVWENVVFSSRAGIECNLSMLSISLRCVPLACGDNVLGEHVGMPLRMFPSRAEIEQNLLHEK